jgi:WD40 repeat protein
LYALLTGQSPFPGNEPPAATLRRVMEEDPPPPRRLNPATPRDLETICLKCLEKVPARRYASAEELAGRLRLFLENRPIPDRPVSTTERLWRWSRRNPILAVVSALAVTLFLVIIVGAPIAIVSLNAERGRAVGAEGKAIGVANDLRKTSGDLKKANEDLKKANEDEKEARELAEDRLATSTMQLAKSRFEENNAGLADDLLEQVPARFRLTPWRLLKSYVAGSLCTLHGHRGRVNSVAFAADGQVLASANDTTIKLWDARTGQELRTLRGHTGWVRSVAFAADGHVLASASDDGTVKLWDARTGQELRTLPGHTEWVSSVAFAPDGQVLASASDKSPSDPRRPAEIKLWDARTGQGLRTLRGHTLLVTSVAFAADGRVLASGSYDGTVKLWDARTGQEVRTLRGHTDVVTSVVFAPDGRVLASASWDKTVKLWDARTGQELLTLRGHTGQLWSVAFAPDSQVLASASSDMKFPNSGEIKLWDVRTGQELRTLRGHTTHVRSVAFTVDGQVLASGSSDGTVKLWDARTGQELRTLRGHTDQVVSVAFAADGQVLASASGTTVKLWDVRTGQELRTLRGHEGHVTSLAFSPDGQVLASGGQDGTVRLWDTRTWEEAPGGTISERERRFRLWVTGPDLHLHRELAEQAENDKQPFVVAFRLARYLAGKNYYANEPRQSVNVAGWLGTASDPLSLLAGLPARVRTPFHEPSFPDGIACTGVLYKDSNIAPARLLIGTSRALQGDPSNWLNHAFHGGALYRNGEHAKALAELTEAVRLHGKPSPLTHNFLALTYLAQGEKNKAEAALAQAALAEDPPWEDILLDRLFQPEIEAAFGKRDIP